MKTIVNTALVAAALHLPLVVGQAYAQDNSATVQQTGSGNLVTLDQAEAVSTTRAQIVQTGSNNAAAVVQRANLLGEVSISQTGTGNEITATERNATVSGIDARQEGSNNAAVLAQISVFPFLIRTSQRGADNAIVVDERIGGFGGPVVTQEGSGNRARVVHGDDYYSGIGIEQQGSRNQADLRQTSAYMTDGMFIIQHGADHRATVSNSGSMNSMRVSQTGSGHTSTTDQLGSSNRGVLFQR